MGNMTEPCEYVTSFTVYIYNSVYLDISEDELKFKIDGYKCQISSARKGQSIRDSDVLRIRLSAFKTETEANTYRDDKFIPRFGFFLNSNGASFEVACVRTFKVNKAVMFAGYGHSYGQFNARKTIPFDICTEPGLEFDEKARIALSLVNSAIKVQETPGAILLLIGALEALSETKKRTDDEVSVINDLICRVKRDAKLTECQKRRMKNGLEGLKSEGSKSACLRVVQLYGSKSGDSVNASVEQARGCESQKSVQTEVKDQAEELFDECYKLRNKIIHGGSLPNDLLNYEIPLRRLVIDVLEGYLKDHKKRE